MTAPPAKIKAFLATIKETYLDDGSSASPDHLFEGLMKMELVLRGLLVQDNSKLWQQVQSSVGKTLLDASKIPKPLLAGANVMAGRVAEACPTAANTVDASVLQRAREIQDQRWIILLEQKCDPLEIARGYFTTAALIQSDTPPMWKKVWDAWVLRSSRGDNVEDPVPFEAQTAIENLIRIAALKGNNKRVAELKLRLAESLLNSNRILSDSKASEAFGDTTTADLPMDPMVLARRAQETLDECIPEELVPSDQRLHTILQYRAAYSLEEATIVDMAQTKHRTDQNRSVSSNLEDCRKHARRTVLTKSEDPLEELATRLRDTFLSSWNEQSSDEIPSLPANKWVQTSIRRLVDRAQLQSSQGKHEVWDSLSGYIMPLLNAMEVQSGWSLPTHETDGTEQLSAWLSSCPKLEQDLSSLVAVTLSKVFFMGLATNSAPMDKSLRFASDILLILIHQGLLEEKKTASAVGSKGKGLSLVSRWKSARAILECGVCQGHGSLIEQATIEAISRRGDVEGSLGIVQCLVAWSGWFQNSWPYCTNLGDIRKLLARAKQSPWRELCTAEEVLLALAHADTELLNGGSPSTAADLYGQTLQRLEQGSELAWGNVLQIFQAHCYNGLARACLLGVRMPDTMSIETLARKSLALLQGLDDEGIPVYIWHESSVVTSAIAHQRSVARKLIADTLVSQGRTPEAKSFLEAAILDSPLDATAALAMGAFLLRVVLYSGVESPPEESKEAQIQLLKAAKLDPSKADPFAMLGLWFEDQGDLKRASGCYSKSLALDECNPIAGRGLLRLESREATVPHLQAAIDGSASNNGWAWRAMGLNKVFLEGEDELAVVALLKSLRCRDVSFPENDTLSIFYNLPSTTNVNDIADVLAEVAMCYRRLGRFTASLRAFHAAIEAAGALVSSSVLCSCAQVELELTLFDDAAKRFEQVLACEGGGSHEMAAYGQGVALLSLAQRDFEDGKAGASLARLRKAIDSCESISAVYGCVRKLVGDMYSFGASLPPNVFANLDDSEGVSPDDLLQRQLEFVGKGEEAYRSAISARHAMGFEEPAMPQAAGICDMASNILLQAQVCASQNEKGQAHHNRRQVEELCTRATAEFKNALNQDPSYAPAWCGLGCAVLEQDPLLAQHSFSRCLQIEKMFPDAYANIGFMYTNKKAFRESENVMNAFTEVADSPMMWMNRAFILERTAADGLGSAKASGSLAEAADAYRAALQVMKHPAAQLGLATTGRVTNTIKLGNSHPRGDNLKRKDCGALTTEFLGASCLFRKAASLFGGILALEQATREAPASSWKTDLFSCGQELTNDAIVSGQLDETLDMAAVKEIFSDQNRSEEKENERQVSFIAQELSLQRQICHEPNRADLWLTLAKDLLSSKGDQTPDRAVESALVAAERATNMLTGNLTAPSCADGEGRSHVDAEILSEAVSLVHCLQDCNRRNSDKKDGLPETSPYDLQRSLMMCPTNRIAREALKEGTH